MDNKRVIILNILVKVIIFSFLLSWFQQMGVLEQIFGKSAQPEILKRSSIYFYIKSN